MVGILVVIVMPAINKILVIRLSSIGDIILTTPLLRHLDTAYPEVQIDFLVKPHFVSLVASNPRLTAIYTTEQLPAAHYDLVVDLQNNSSSRAIVRSLNAGKTVHYHKENWKKWLLVHFKINRYGSCRSVVERYLDSLKQVAVTGDSLGCEIYPSLDDKAFASPFFESGHKTLGVCFGAKHFTKRFPPKHFAALFALLLEKETFQLLLLGGKEDLPYASEIMSILPEGSRSMLLNLAGDCTLMQTAAILERCDAVLCNDTGLMHMASSFGKKLFVLFGSSSSAFGFLPYHVPYDLFQVEGLPCRPCSHIGRDHCPKGHFRCMNDLSVALIAGHILDHFTSAR